MRIIEGNLVAKDLKVGIVAGRFNEFIVSKLVGGAIDGLKRHGVDEDNIDLAWVPGAFEIPLVAKQMAAGDAYDAVICLGAVIKGRHRISIMSALKYPKALRAFRWIQENRSSSVC